MLFALQSFHCHLKAELFHRAYDHPPARMLESIGTVPISVCCRTEVPYLME